MKTRTLHPVSAACRVRDWRLAHRLPPVAVDARDRAAAAHAAASGHSVTISIPSYPGYAIVESAGTDRANGGGAPR